MSKSILLNKNSLDISKEFIFELVCILKTLLMKRL